MSRSRSERAAHSRRLRPRRTSRRNAGSAQSQRRTPWSVPPVASRRACLLFVAERKEGARERDRCPTRARHRHVTPAGRRCPDRCPVQRCPVRPPVLFFLTARTPHGGRLACQRSVFLFFCFASNIFLFHLKQKNRVLIGATFFLYRQKKILFEAGWHFSKILFEDRVFFCLSVC